MPARATARSHNMHAHKWIARSCKPAPACAHAHAHLVQGVAYRQLGRHLGDGEAGGLRGQGRGAAHAWVHLNDDHVAIGGVDGHLRARAAQGRFNRRNTAACTQRWTAKVRGKGGRAAEVAALYRWGDGARAGLRGACCGGLRLAAGGHQLHRWAGAGAHAHVCAQRAHG